MCRACATTLAANGTVFDFRARHSAKGKRRRSVTGRRRDFIHLPRIAALPRRRADDAPP
ncbi:hypothetical protein BIWAKO_04882 [Bosea sp. BIWAKO-01]|jgi:hypothetical protein|nr:hypothetical protein BIWAKO_04882 [Bosea sp. BIWAKO-01]